MITVNEKLGRKLSWPIWMH